MNLRYFLISAIFSLGLSSCTINQTPLIQISKDQHIILIGNNLPSRMMNYGFFETDLHLRYPDSSLYIRNMGDGGNTPGFRPHSGRNTPWTFDGAEKFQMENAKNSHSEGHLNYPDEWLTTHKADLIVAFFGFNEAFEMMSIPELIESELQAFIDHTKTQIYNGKSVPELVLVAPTAIEDISDKLDVPKGIETNKKLDAYTKIMSKVAFENEVAFIDLFEASKKWYDDNNDQLTIDGLQLNEKGYQLLAKTINDQLFGITEYSKKHHELVHNAVLEKNWMWHNDFKIPNGVHVFGRRYDPFGPDNYPFELKKIRELTAIRDTAIWNAAQGIVKDLKVADAKTSKLPPVETNYQPGDYGRGGEYLYGQDAIDKIHVADGYKLELFASETDFPELANPVQISFDNKGRLWVAVMPTYPHYKPGDSKPNDKILIIEDTNNDGKGDVSKIWADNLHIPVGFELAPEGVYVSQGTNLILLSDTNGDDKADTKEIILSGFDDHDTHHVISAFCADPSGAIYMGEGVFLHSNIETTYGPVRATNGGFFRFNAVRRHLERVAQIAIPNPWGTAFDDYGQDFFLETSGPAIRWMMPSQIKNVYGTSAPKSRDLAPESDKVRPTSGLEFVSSRHFPDEVQGDMLLGNAIGYLGIKQHQIEDEGTGYKTAHRQDLLWSDDTNFRPVDLEFAPDGSLYFVDWHNILIGHMQHNARDPFRDHAHGRIYRVTYPSRPLVERIDFTKLSIEETLETLKLPEYRTRYRAKRVLRGKNPEEVINALQTWVEKLDSTNENYERYLLEALWVSWGLNAIDESILSATLNAQDFRVRAAAVRALRYNGHLLKNQNELLQNAANDVHGRVRLEAIVTASWLPTETGQSILDIAAQHELDDWMLNTFLSAQHRLTGTSEITPEVKEVFPEHLAEELRETYRHGKSIYEKEGFCSTCHQIDGKGLPASGFPPLANSEWVLDNDERLIKLTLKGLQGPITVLGKDYPGQVPMTPFEGMLNDDEMAAVLTYIKNAFGNKGAPILKEDVKKLRDKIADKKGFYSPQELN